MAKNFSPRAHKLLAVFAQDEAKKSGSDQLLPEHFIQWIALETNQGSQIKYLQPGQAPRASFALAEGEEVKAVYEYCNLHGLWKA